MTGGTPSVWQLSTYSISVELDIKKPDGSLNSDLFLIVADSTNSATPYWNRGKQVRDIKGKHGAPFGETIMQNATEGTIKEMRWLR
jgi:hypothetical protein